MPRKSTKALSQAAPAGDGVIARVIDRAFENPAMSGGLMVMALTASAIISNALFLQNGRHPDPLFMPRPAPFVRELPRPAPSRPPSVEAEGRSIAMPPLPRLAPRAEPVVPPVAVDPQITLIADIQRELARLGLYSGAMDGVAGSRTVAAINAYEIAAGLMPTGKATPELLTAMKTPLPPRSTGSINPDSSTSAMTTTELDRRERERAEKIAAEQRAGAAAQLQANYVTIQGALNRIGYGPIPIDGAASADTADAIRRFELDNGLPITGEANDRLIGRLISIGAIKTT